MKRPEDAASEISEWLNTRLTINRAGLWRLDLQGVICEALRDMERESFNAGYRAAIDALRSAEARANNMTSMERPVDPVLALERLGLK